MPVTAKFSEEFYHRFGHTAVDELVTWINEVDATYRSELRDLNELNFERFDSKLEQRVAQLEAKIDQRSAQLEAGLARLEGGLLARIGMAEGRLARLTVTLTLTFWVTTMATLVALVKL